MTDRRYESIPEFSPEEVHAALDRNDPNELLYAVVSVALYSADPVWGSAICARLTSHPDFNVRGNALLGFGHLARLHGVLDRTIVQPLIEAGLHDADPYVRSEADNAADDVEQYLGWTIIRTPAT